MKKKFPVFIQADGKDCGPTCLRIVAKYYGKLIPLQIIRKLSETTREGSSLLGLSDAAEKLGFRTLGVRINFETLVNEVPLPCIVHWEKQHFVVVYDIKYNSKSSRSYVKVSDPSYGLIDYPVDEFLKNWIGSDANETSKQGIALILEPTPTFQSKNWTEETQSGKRDFLYLSKFFFRYKALIFQLILGLAAGSLLTLAFPFLTQSIVDIGIQNQDINFIYLILLAQIMLFIGRMSIEIIRGWILLHLSARISISLVSEFFIKLMNLPISFFDTRMTGDILQRINDHNRIEKILTGSSLDTLFSLINIIVFSTVLAYYDFRILLIFFTGSLLYFGWIFFFLKKRRELDYKRFSQIAQEQSTVMELVNGMQEIKLHNAEKQKRWGWEFVQVKLFKISMKSLALEQTQTVGSNFINQLKDIFITFMSASLVISGELTLGMMLSIQYIIGQLNSPLTQVVGFIQQIQDAKISLERLNEVHNKEDEETIIEDTEQDIPAEDIVINDLSFRYIGSADSVLKNINCRIPYKKITAIVGTSGSGKTTLMKLLMKFYSPDNGKIMIGNVNLQNLSQKAWRANCGVVMQDGFIFNDSIAQNIAIGDDQINKIKLEKALKIANIEDFIENLPLGYNTKIGNEGIGMSGGQKQRLMIARAVYKNPNILFFDEATSSLDANNEKTIMENLNLFLKGKTAIIIAHRLSTVKNADQIIVMDNGNVIETGSHQELLEKKGSYFNLVKNQLELEKINRKS
ncbi:peptidase domain-containing ABC transporter [Moheibacter sediminis]|uniref:ATP-binding cassette, subfamily B n=1 Tax=Moheibacter sediminis TaxID=1434700 RepID=A0A1W2D0J6_9FLAO|nr:peptidase domain-containing ABC transporter [Moheibacter sediminis]SMC90980.1 ATP-binding cassette, subfamily B [Moheibacter sediminis]